MRLQSIKNRIMAAFLVLSPLMSVGSALPVSAVDQNCTWTGATSLTFNNAGNWSGCGGGVPGVGDNLLFDSTSLVADTDINNDIPGLSVKTVTFQSTSGVSSYSISGNGLTITTGVVSNVAPARFNANVIVGGNISLSATSMGYIDFLGGIAGTGSITSVGGYYITGTDTHSGNVSVTNGFIYTSSTSLTSGETYTVGNGASIFINDCAVSDLSIAGNVVLSGSAFSIYSTKMNVGGGCLGGGGGSSADEAYLQSDALAGQKYTLNGSLTLANDITLSLDAESLTLAGTLSGAYAINLSEKTGGTLKITSSSNGTTTTNGIYAPVTVVKTLSDSLPATSVKIGDNAVVTINGARGDVNVLSGGTLKGSGTVGLLSVQTGGKLAVGNSPGCMNTGNLSLVGSYDAEIGGATACTGYDQTNVTGTVDVTSGTLNTIMVNGFAATAGQQFIIINNDGSDAVTGTFAGLTNGAVFAVGDGQFRINYDGGTGNDVVLTVITAPSVPDTGFELLRANPLITLAATILAAAAILVVAQRSRQTR